VIPSMASLSEEELAAYELNDEDLLMLDEDEEAEWREYDEEVERYRELMAAAGDDSPADDGYDAFGGLEGFDGLEGLDAAALLEALEPEDVEIGVAPEVTAPDLSRRRESSEAELDELIQTASDMKDELRELLTAARDQAVADEEATPALAPELSPPAAATATTDNLGFEIPASYLKQLEESKGGVIVSRRSGENTVVIVSRVPDQPELLPELSDLFRAMRVRVVRGWLSSAGGLAMDVFEVCDELSGKHLSEEEAGALKQILARLVRAPAARQVTAELDGQVPPLQAFFGLPESESEPPSIAKVRRLVETDIATFKVFECRDLGRALVFRGSLPDGDTPGSALFRSRQRLQALTRADGLGDGTWDCLLAKGYFGLLLVVYPVKDLERYLQPYFDERLVFFISLLLTVISVTKALPATTLTCLLVFVGTGLAEFARRVVATCYGVRMSLPFILPSPALGTLGAASRTSVVESSIARFDMSAAALSTAFVVSLLLMIAGFAFPLAESTCTWVSPRTLPFALQNIVMRQAEQASFMCEAPMPNVENVPASPALVAGVFLAFSTALNALPLAGLDGAAVAATTQLTFLRETLLPLVTLLLLGFLTFDSNSTGVLPTVLVFLFITFLVRPQLESKPVFRDNVSEPLDLGRRGLAVVFFLISFAVLVPPQFMAPFISP